MGRTNESQLEVRVVETTVTPVAGQIPSGTAVLTLSNSTSLQGSSWQLLWRESTITMPVMDGTIRVIFTWRNSTGNPYNPPAAVDNIGLSRR